jgi:hypothetical protein
VALPAILPGLRLTDLLCVAACFLRPRLAGLVRVTTRLLGLRLSSMLATTARLPRLRLLRVTAATAAAAAARLTCLLAVASATATTAVVLGSSVATSISVAVAAAMRTSRCGRANRQGGHSSGQNNPGHDKKLPSFQAFNEDVGRRVPATKFASSATGCISTH